MNRDDVTIPEPCHADWSDMDGGDRKRFCGQCSKHVHNLSEMTEPQARAVLKQPKVCVRYTADQSGNIRFQPSRRALLRRGAVLGGLLSVSLPAAAAMMVDSGAAEPARPSWLRRLWNSVAAPEPVMGEMAEVEIAPVPEPAPELLVVEQGGVGEMPVEMGRIAVVEEEE